MKIRHILFFAMSAMGLGVMAQEPDLSVAEIFTMDEDSVSELLPPINVRLMELPVTMFMPAIYKPYNADLYSSSKQLADSTEHSEAWPWLHDAVRISRHADALRQYLTIHSPQVVKYNLMLLPEPPKQYVMTADPEKAMFVIAEVGPVNPVVAAVEATEISRQYWLNKFNTNIQFSQAYISPNWYQGGNSSLSLLADFTYQSNLNTKFHPNLLFENFFQWRTSLTSTPDDPYRNYSITENRFQINSKFGYKAAHNWYYSLNAMLKTPVFCGYKSGTQTRTASFMSPGEFNLGVGMTYNFTNKKNTFTLGVTISPLSYNLKTVIDPRVDEVAQGLTAGHKGKNDVGSSAEVNWTWKICYNVQWKSRIFAFTNYKLFQGDWQNQFTFTINRFLTANLNIDMRYDTSVDPTPDSKWRKLQLREGISLGFAYTISH